MTKTLTRSLVLAVACGALVLTAAGTAAADTNKSQQTSNISGPVAALLSPGAGPGDNHQSSEQNMFKRHTSNWSVIDYIEAPGLPSIAAGL
ncbi:hypothetical protein GCM10018785_42340 [Streptomyces longispororuber]|uniref:Secreted protein n=1 Tax=Streptomyces longispororuber TaxID=68230 RepID=A0A918ZTI5_9ACTN|nr:hypothetical protein [Streptomyces longispororuber]GHE69329.1 hypothetical protein GCM10018785_42340 [Streptomyces longispororuber]